MWARAADRALSTKKTQTNPPDKQSITASPGVNTQHGTERRAKMPANAERWTQCLLPWERAGLWLFLVAILVFGGIVEKRSVFLTRRMTDADDYFRAAWAVRTGQDMYSAVDTNGWHYNYPPFFAIVLQPLANPPPSANSQGFVPYPVSVAAWYLISVGFFLLAVHWLATALEQRSGVAIARWDRRWWWLRMATVLICLMALGRTLSRGQVNTLVLFFFAGMIALLLANRHFAAGLCLSVPICIKVYPAFLLIAPMVRRDLRWLTGCICGLIFGLLIVPLLALGPRGTLDAYRRYNEVLIRPALGLQSDPIRDFELTGATGTDSQSFSALLYNITDPNRIKRPVVFAPWIRAAHWTIGAAFAAVTLAVGLRARRHDAIGTTLFLGTLIVVMLPISPVCHIHYFIFAMPLIMGLLAAMWERTPFPRVEPAYVLLFGANIVLNVVSALPGFQSWKDYGVTLGATLLLWGAGIFELARTPIKEQSSLSANA